MQNLNNTLWNPLSFLCEDVAVEELNPDEIYSIGEYTADIAQENDVSLSGLGSKILGREVGDDRVDLSRTPDGLCCALAVQERVIRMVTSKEDTSVRKYSWNFCEVTSGVPTDPTQGFDHVRKDGDFTNLGFNDSIVLRIILDVQKGEGEDHSSTEPGKMSMLGSRLATPRRENRGMWMLASMFQDSMLCTHKASEPKYLPPQMGGTGVTALFDNPTNIYLYVLAYKGGTYNRIYATAVAELRECLYSMERGVQTAPILASRLREKQDYFWGTYDNLVFIPRPDALQATPGLPIPTPLYTATGGANRYQNFENRLLRTKLCVTRRAAQVEWEHTRRLQNIVLSILPSMKDYARLDKDRVRTLRARYDNALSANSALQNLLKREATRHDAQLMMGDKAFHTLTVGKLTFTPFDAEWVYSNGQGETLSLRDISLSEDIFVREEVSVEETFKVGGITLRPIYSQGPVTRYSKTKVGLYQINQTMEEWAEDLLGRLQEAKAKIGRPLHPDEMGTICDQDTEWVNDDSGLIARCHRDNADAGARHAVILISGDRRLANQMAETSNVLVIRILPREYVVACTNRGLNPQEVNRALLNEKLGRACPPHIYIDMGSLAADSVSLVQDSGTIYRRTVLDTGWDGDRRFSKVNLTEQRVSFRFRVEKHYPITRPRYWRSGSTPAESSYSSHASWRRGTSSSSESSWWRQGPPPVSGI